MDSCSQSTKSREKTERIKNAFLEEIAAALFWLGTEDDALPLAKAYTMIDLQPLYKERVAATV